ncbi:MAG: hypothetical protein E7559_00130 [Ruminococcaceae bacterium]|nr:hypothetical protein [Oscillospiraceae bacterium]
MKRLDNLRSTKDRIICVSEPNTLCFYYQPVGSGERIFLFRSKAFNATVFNHFRKMGRRAPERGYSLTIGELYSFRKDNPRLLQTINHIFLVLRSLLQDEDCRSA